MPLFHIHRDAVAITDIGGLAVHATNKTGANSVKGTVIMTSTGTDGAFMTAGADSTATVGIVYEDGIADGDKCWVVISGIAQVLLKDNTASTRGYWVQMSDVAGRADATVAAPPGGGVPEIDNHMQEIGHAVQTQAAGTDVLCTIVLHLN